MVTIRDIAKETGLSIATVSKCLNGQQVKPENKAAIDEAVERLHYLPNASARSMRTQSTKIIALIVPTMKIIMIPEITMVCSEILIENGYYPIVCVTNGDPEIEKNYLLKCASHNVDGIISMPTCTDIDIYKKLDANGIPYVFFEQYVPGMDANTVRFSGIDAAEEMVTAVHAAGHEHGAVIFGHRHAQAFQSRFSILKSVVEKHGYILPPEYVIFTETNIISGNHAMKQLLALPEPPTVVFCLGEELTIGAYSALRQTDLIIPDDIALIGLKNTTNIDFTEPLSITCLMQPNEQLGKACVTRLLELLKMKENGTDSTKEHVHITIPVKFVPGDTL